MSTPDELVSFVAYVKCAKCGHKFEIPLRMKLDEGEKISDLPSDVQFNKCWLCYNKGE